MTDLKPGDRVHVEFDGVVDARAFRSGRVSVHVEGGRPHDSVVPAEFVTKYDPPFEVGDKIETVDDLERLPLDAVVVQYGGSGDQAVNQRIDGGFKLAGWDGLWTADDIDPTLEPAIIVYLPDGAA